MEDFEKYFEEKVFFFDIETVTNKKTFSELDDRSASIWELMCQRQPKLKDKLNEGSSISDIYSTYASLYTEFNTIVTIAYGFLSDKEDEIESITIHKDSFDEEELLKNFSTVLSDCPPCKLSGYNITLFDMPNLAKKIVKYGIKLPKQLHIFNKKPWDINALDLSNVWRGTSNDFISLDGLSNFLGFKSSKEFISGDKVSAYYYENPLENIELIEKYCKGDVYACIEVYRKFKSAGILY